MKKTMACVALFLAGTAVAAAEGSAKALEADVLSCENAREEIVYEMPENLVKYYLDGKLTEALVISASPRCSSGCGESGCAELCDFEIGGRYLKMFRVLNLHYPDARGLDWFESSLSRSVNCP